MAGKRKYVGFMENAEDHMGVAGRQDFALTSFEPALACLRFDVR